jgi:cystathionine beta-lyase/cystathionine gamma-synthase
MAASGLKTSMKMQPRDRSPRRAARRNAIVLVGRLADHPAVLVTRYPGVASHPTHEAARRQLKGFGTIISFGIHGCAEAADAVWDEDVRVAGY